MTSALHIITRVLPGNRIEVSSPELQEGQTVEIIVQPQAADNGANSAIEIIEAAHRLSSGRSTEEIDRQLEEERNSWDR